jgi:rubredoxin
MSTSNDTPASLSDRLLALFNTSVDSIDTSIEALIDTSFTSSPPAYDAIIHSTLNDMESVFTEWEHDHNLSFITSVIHRRRTQLLETGSFTSGDEDFLAYHAPPSETASDATEPDVPDDMLCTICGRRQISVQFRDCVHASCKDCAKGMWRARIQYDGHFPDYWHCPLCRRYVYEVKEIRAKDDEGEAREIAVMEWILEVSKSAKEMVVDVLE